ncbi:MAG TPA: tail fiber domain-containing protein, partial [Thermoanaerobaculia bacterium]|nr:tail fiber domain-containing protein [Thermoanaerobaculia bacterium]
MKSFRWTLLAVTAIACGLALTISVSAGERPEAVSPGNGSGTVIAGACPSFSWGAVAGATSYELVTYQVPEGLSAKASPSDLKELWRVTVPGSARSWTPPANRCFSHGGSYAWAVRAVVDGQPGTWSEANLFTIEKAPSAEEVRGTIAELRRYLVVSRTRRAGTRGAESKLRTRSSATPRATPTALRARMADGGIRRAAGAAERAGGLHSLKSASGTPSLGTPSLTIDSSLSLGSSSSVFKNGKVFLWDDTVGNLALGDSALASVSSYASENTAVGQDALRNTAGNAVSFVYGSFNTASGFEALYHNTTGFDNTASGWEALYRNTTGAFNTVSGYEALYFNTTGSGNIAIGTFAGYAAGYGGASDNYDIFIGNLGYASDSGVTRIGDFHQKSAFIAGIDGVNVGSSGTTVLINSSGQLGTSTSSRRFKQGIENMGDVTDKLYELRPVIFRYKQWVREAIK